MKNYLIKRVLWMLPTLFIITLLSYCMMRLAPGDPVKSSLLAAGSTESGPGVKNEGESNIAKEFRKRFYLDQPWYVGYWHWLFGDSEQGRGGVIRGDFGDSIVISLGTPVWKVIKDRIPVTVKLNIWAFIVIYLVAIPFGLYSAIFKNSKIDKIVSFIFFIFYSLPSFWVGLMLILFVFKFLPWWPISGLSANIASDKGYWQIFADSALHYVLPVICLSYGGFASLSRFTRSAILENIRLDYVRTARAKGLSEWNVLIKHVVRNSLIPLITLSAGLLPGMLAGSMIIEYLFNIPGMGTLMISALSSRDYPVLMTEVGLGACLVLVGILLSDILYAVVDPRIKFE